MSNSTTYSGSISESSSKALLLSHGALRYLFLVPSSFYEDSKHLRDEFISSLLGSSGEDDTLSSIQELVSCFLGYIAWRLETSADSLVNREILRCILRQFETDVCHGNEIHAVAAALSTIQSSRSTVIKHYYSSLSALDLSVQKHDSSLIRASRKGNASIYTIFGGQGNNEFYFSELRELYTTYHHFLRDFITVTSEHLERLSGLPEARKSYSRGLSPKTWLCNPDAQPDTEYLLAAPLSFPLIGLLQLAHYAVTCKILGVSPGDLRQCFKGVSGHSQGIVAAVAISRADSWDAYTESTKTALTLLFWVGLRSQQAFPQTALVPALIQESIAAGAGSPTPMLNVRDLEINILQQEIDNTNQYLPPDKRIHIGLFNGSNHFVVSGPPMSLCGLNSRLLKIKNTPGLDQSRLPFRERKVSFTNTFLPITAPFHSPYLSAACEKIYQDVNDLEIAPQELLVPVYSTIDGTNLGNSDRPNIVTELVRMITCSTLHWKQATTFQHATHILDFGPGGALGIGYLTQKIKDGQGVRVISATSISSSANMGSKDEIFDPNADVKYAANWVKEYGPHVIETKTGTRVLDTKFSKLLGLPPLMVAGMTPCTVPWDFVAATMNAGYHIELAGGGYYSPRAFADAIRKIVANTPPGRGVTLNLIYVNPSAIAWQIPLIKQLRAEGVPIDGLTIGAGVPTIEIATEYIKSLGLRHIAFKPGSVESIYKVIEIAKYNPDFPVILQWTGGRGGGHHSFEDFHQPILQTYSKIRDCPNMALVAGSGFGGAEDTYPYLTGTWASQFDRAPMPFDGILFGSRIMIAKEAHTSQEVKKAIVEAQGIDDSQWEATYKGPAGGVMTVLSEMREPIHKLATRGVRFWAEMDKTIFNLDRSKRVAALQEKRDYIIQKLNDDFQKVWFGRSTAGQSVEIEEMTYSEVLLRLAELLYIKSQSRWIDESYKTLFGNLVRRVEERFARDNRPSLIQGFPNIVDPFILATEVVEAYPNCSTQLVTAQDAQYFLIICQTRGQKPVPFIPALDENFEYWFKKDSLWQSEDIDAVVGQDVGRTCILQGPVAVKYATIADEPVKNILDGIRLKHVEKFVADYETSAAEYGSERNTARDPDIVHRISHSTHSALPCPKIWFGLLAGNTPSWRQAFFLANTLVQGHNVVDNPLKRLFAPAWNIEVIIRNPNEQENMCITLRESASADQEFIDVIEMKAFADMMIGMTILERRNALGLPVGLSLSFTYHPEARFAPFREIMDGKIARVKEFYWKLWFGDDQRLPSSLIDQFSGGTYIVKKEEVADFIGVVRNHNEAYVTRQGKRHCAPMDFAIKAAWKGMMMPLFLVEGNLLDLVHLSNGFRMLPNAKQLQVDDVLEVTSRVNVVRILGNGKMVEVCGTISSDGNPIIKVTSRFLYRGVYLDYDSAFERKTEIPLVLSLKSAREVALLRSKEWFHTNINDAGLIDQRLVFRLESLMQQGDKEACSSVQTHGKVYLQSSTGEDVLEVGKVEYCTTTRSMGNPVIDFLERNGSPIEQPQMFKCGVKLNGSTALSFQAPASNELYAAVSGDFNPIHVSRIFSAYAGLPGPITHGMLSSASVRGLVEIWAAENDVSLIKSFDCTFDNMILPNDQVDVNLWHVGMIAGRKIVNIEALKNGTDKVLSATTEVEQPASAYMFTGQGSQFQGMGMDLYAQNQAARTIWDRADKFLMENYGMTDLAPSRFNLLTEPTGFSILEIVRTNPTSLKIHFGGRRGREIRHNYIRMVIEKPGHGGQMIAQKVFEDIDETTTSYVFSSHQGLLYSTQFAQPALTLVAQATYAVMHEQELIQENSSYAGHSLGEYAALTSFGEFMPIENLVSIVFYRGLTMQLCVERDELGRTNYSMCAINPSKVCKGFYIPR